MFKLPVSRIERLKLNKRLLFFIQLFIEIKSLNAVIQLFYLQRGLDIGQIVFVSLVWSVTVLVFDLPSSYLADRIGRKKALFISVMLTSASIFMMYFANGFLSFAVLYVLMAAGYAFFQGTDEALLFDSLKETGDEKGVTRVTGKYFASQNLAKIFVPFLGAVVAKNLSASQFNILITIDLTGSLISLFLIQYITEPNRFMDAAKMRLGIFKDAFKIVFADKVLMRFSLNRILVFEGAFLFWRVYQVVLNSAEVSVFFLGLIYFMAQVIMFLAMWHSQKIIKKLGGMNYVWLPVLLGIISLIIALFSENPTVLVICAIPLFVLGTIRDPIFFSQIHRRITSFNRATVISALTIIKSIIDIPLLILAGYLARIEAKYVWVVALIMLIGATVFGPVAKKDIIEE
jgi:MFS family permease